MLSILSIYLAFVGAAVVARVRQPDPEAALNRDESGITIIEWLVMAIVAVAALVVLRTGIIDLAERILRFLGDALGI